MVEYLHILLKPDAFYRGVVKDILETLEVNQIQVFVSDIIRPNEILLGTMYDKNFCWEYDYYYHNRKLYELGPCLSLVCKYDKKKDYKQLKGSSLPINPRVGSIRQQFQVKDRTLNLIHIADTLDNSQKEIETIYKIKALENIIAERPLDKNIVECLDTLNQTKELHFESVIKTISSRIMRRIKCILTLNGMVYCQNDNYDLSRNHSLYERYVSPDLLTLYYLVENLGKTFRSKDSSRGIRELEYFKVLLKKEMIYVSEMEKYVMMGQCLYNSVNL